MPCVIQIVCSASQGPGPEDGKYIKDFIPDGDALGIGRVIVTSDKDKAKRFDGAREAMEFWKQRSKRVPTRTAGPTRPLTAFTVEIEKV